MPVSRIAGLGSIVLGPAMVFTALAAPATAADPFTLVVVPDTQNYTDFENINNQYNKGQMNWIVANKAAKNIKFVMHMGDMQNPGNPYYVSATDKYSAGAPRFPNDPERTQDIIDGWERADAAIDILDAGGVPYSIVPGNHDYLDHDTKTEPYLFLQKFGPSRYNNNPKFDEKGLKIYGGSSPETASFAWAGMNSYHRFNAGGYRFLNIALQYAPDSNDLAWAQEIINANPGVPTIVTTHSYVNTKPAGSDYQRPIIWDRLVKNNPQIVMTFNGHLTGAHHVNDTNVAGLPVHQFLVDFQASQLDTLLGADYYRGGGVLRTVTIDTDRSRVDLQDYSPVANKNLPMGEVYTAKDNDNDTATYDTPASVNIDWDGRFGLQNKAGIVRTQTLRDGVNGYNATTDTWIDANAPTTTHGGDTEAWVDGNRANGNPSQALIRFDLFGAGEIPKGSMIESATLVLHTSQKINDTDNPQSPDGMAIYRLLETFGNSTSWNTDGGYSIDGLEAILAASGTVIPSTAGTYVSFNVTESMYAWSMGATNHGWVLDALGNNGWRFDTSEHANINFRPQLSVTYRMVPEPAAAGMLTILALGGLARRRRT